ncbi:hypothetical protein GCM10025876_08400 [Demequina litorisediminis]|uniref:Uncharacterized protein n=1 Tax=Demequina litorisediminis TaxID=1849022 RepID=A0ABQ6IBJ8_9MICO|nr:hypothetical protein GCM10025876_08400 [Demequina litorisediminis]
MATKRKGMVNLSRPGYFVYGSLAAVMIASLFPFYWSFLIGSGDASTIRDPNMSWLPGGNFFANASTVINADAVNFWKALGNSLIVSTTVSITTVVLSTLAGYAFAKPALQGQQLAVRGRHRDHGRAGPGWALFRCTSSCPATAGRVRCGPSSFRRSSPRSACSG